MLFHKSILPVLTIVFIIANTSSQYKLKLANFPTFKYSSSLNFYSDAKITFNDPSRYTMRKLLLRPDELIIIVSYMFEKETVLAKRISELNTFAWIYVDELNPFKILSYKVGRHTPDKVLRMIEKVPYGKTVGMDQILTYLNTVDWDQQLYKSFFKNCSFSRMHVSRRDQMKTEISLIRKMMQNKYQYSSELLILVLTTCLKTRDATT